MSVLGNLAKRVRLSIFKTHINRPMNEQEIKAISDNIAQLEAGLTGNMFADMEKRDQIHNLKMKLNGVRPANSEIDCVGCGS